MKTPIAPDNAPRKPAIAYRVGAYGDFRETMLARLSDSAPPFAPLKALRTRAPDDPTIALIDAFAAVGDVLTFYQERLANEGYLRTATEPRSVTELARLTGYRPKAGVASSVFLAFTADLAASLTLAAGARAQSVPGPGQTAQSFETSDALPVNGAWNALAPRLSRPTQPSTDLPRIFVAGVATALKPHDPLLIVADGVPLLRRIAAVTVQADRKRTILDLQPPPPPKVEKTERVTVATTPPPPLPSPAMAVIEAASTLAALVQPPPTASPSDPTGVQRSPGALLAPASDAALALAAGATNADRARVYRALDVKSLAPAPSLEVHAFKTVTAPGGNRAPPRGIDSSGRALAQPPEWGLSTPVFGAPDPLSVQVTFKRDGQSVSAGELINEVARDPSVLKSLFVASAISFGAASLTLTLDFSKGDTVTGTLSADAGDIACKLRQIDQTGLILTYAFQSQPVTLRISVSAAGTATAVNEIASDAVTNLTAMVNDSGGGIEVDGLLALKTGAAWTEDPGALYLDGLFDTIAPGTWVAFDAPVSATEAPPPPPLMIADGGVAAVGRTAYGQTARVTRLALQGAWIDPAKTTFDRAIRQTTVYAGSVPLTLVDEDITAPFSTTPSATLELDGFTPGLPRGRWLVVKGERTDLPGSTWSEAVILADSQHGGDIRGARPDGDEDASPFTPGETLHTTLTLAAPLAFTYKLDTVQILGNVAKSTQGESVDEILGAGNGALANQAFTLKKPPLTYISAATPSGVVSTLSIYIAGIRWREVESLGSHGSRARVYVTQGGANGATAVRFGDGVHGARLPTGSDNVRARYRSGLGSSGNVDSGAISTLLSRPLGLKAVTNPKAATGGADAEGPDAIRQAAPLGLVSLSRLVAVRDYEDFAVTFPGVAKASAKRFTGADGPIVHLTIAGALDDALDPQSDLWTSLSAVLDDYGDDEHEVELAPRVAKVALISARVAVDPDRLWSDVEPVIRARLLERFSFSRAAFGRSIHASDVVSTIQTTPGVAYVDLQLLTGVTPPVDAAGLKAAINAGGVADVGARLARVAGGGGARRIVAAELAYLSGSLPDMLVLNEIAS